MFHNIRLKSIERGKRNSCGGLKALLDVEDQKIISPHNGIEKELMNEGRERRWVASKSEREDKGRTRDALAVVKKKLTISDEDNNDEMDV